MSESALPPTIAQPATGHLKSDFQRQIVNLSPYIRDTLNAFNLDAKK